MELDRTERRVVASLVEKRLSMPDQYPLSINALVAACNQKSNRDPRFSLHEFEVTGALLALREKGLVLIREKEGGRVPRYAERFEEKLALSPREAAVLAELMLRGAQTVQELARRVPRMIPVDGPAGVEEALRALGQKGHVRLLPRVAGQRHARWMHKLAPEEEAAGEEEDAPPEPAPPVSAPPVSAPPRPEPPRPEPPPPAPSDLRAEVAALRCELEELRARVARLERT